MTHAAFAHHHLRPRRQQGVPEQEPQDLLRPPLVYYSLSAADLFCKSHPDLAVDLALNTDSPELAALVADKYPEVVFLPRGEALAGDRVPKMAVYQDSLRRMEQKTAGPTTR